MSSSHETVGRGKTIASWPLLPALRRLAAKLGVSAEYLETGSDLAPAGKRELTLTDLELAVRLGDSKGTQEPLEGMLAEAVAAGDADAALEWCEDQLLSGAAYNFGTKFSVPQINLFKGLSPDECRLVEAIIKPLVFEKGDVIMREGDDAKLFFVLARGTVSVEIKVHGKSDRRKRVASIGPGLTFGEMALLDGGKRSADVVANERVICYGLGVEELHELSAEHPNIMITILSNLTRDFSERLRHANEEISVLE